jgi:hypothetical protein
MKKFTIALALFLSVCFAFWVLRRTTVSPGKMTEQEYLANKEEQVRRLSDWKIGPRVSVRSKPKVFQSVSDVVGGKLQIPKEATPVNEKSLDLKVLNSAKSAVSNLISAYGQNSGKAVYDYMASQSETLTDSTVQELQSMLGDAVDGQIGALDGRVVFNRFWEKFKNSNWESLLPETVACSYWRLNSLPGESLRQFEPDDNGKVFFNVSKLRHFFTSDVSMESVLDDHKELLFCDYRFVIELNRSAKSQQVPYYLRFWYDPNADLWHPWLLGCHATGNSTDVPSIAF